jgi:hypothetical protein
VVFRVPLKSNHYEHKPIILIMALVTIKVDRSAHEEAVSICLATNQKIGGYFSDAIRRKNEIEQERMEMKKEREFDRNSRRRY